MEYARRLRALIREAEAAGFYLDVDCDDLDLRISADDDWVATITQVVTN
jgi:hypothetical protein